jgi:hypothetical protein
MPKTPFVSAADWRGPDLIRRTDWVHHFNEAEIAELEGALARARTMRLTLDDVSCETFPLPRFADLAAKTREVIENGPGMMLMRGLPTERYTADDCRMIYWGMGKYLGTAMSQSPEGDVLGDVRDLGVDLSGPKGRGYKTNAELEFHTDSADVVALIVIRTAKIGGRSMIASSVAIHNEIARTRPDLLEVLYQPFIWSMQAQQAAGDSPWYEQPIFTMHEGQFACRYIRTHILSAQRYPEVPRLTPRQLEAMTLVDTLAADPAFHFSMLFDPGDVQVLNNHITLHARTNYEDWPEEDRKRHLLRMWLSVPNSRPLSPALGHIYRDRRPGAVRGGNPSRTGRVVYRTTQA